MLTEINTLEKTGDLLRGNIRYDLEGEIDTFSFVKAKFKRAIDLEKKIEKSINRKITKDDKL